MSLSEAVVPANTSRTAAAADCGCPPTWRGATTIAALVFASRLPFLAAGYGLDPDSWRVAVAARSIADTWQYWPSRFVGYPFHEIVSAGLIAGGPFALNMATALMGAVAAAFVWLMPFPSHRARVASAVAAAFAPVVAVASTESVDYVWGLAFVTGAFYFASRHRAVTAGLMLGAAAGCRITAALAVVPCVLLLVDRRSVRCSLSAAAALTLTAATATLLLYVPVLNRFGLSLVFFPTAAQGWPYPPAREIAGYLTVSIWGRLGAVALAAAIGHRLLSRSDSPPVDVPHRQRLAAAVMATLFIAMFFVHPHKPEYLIPAVPFAVFLLAWWIRPAALVAAAAVIALSSFVSVGRSGPFRGALLAEHSARQKRVDFVREQLAMQSRRSARTVVVAGAWLPMVQGTLKGSLADPDFSYERSRRGSIVYEYTLDQQQLDAYRRQGYAIHCFPGVASYNAALHGVDLVAQGATVVDSAAWGF